MHIQPGQESITWSHFEHFVGALTMIMGLEVKDAMELAWNDLMDARIGIHCPLSERPDHATPISEETLRAVRELGGL